MSLGMFYVCDDCGHIEVSDPVPEDGEWTCRECRCHRAWEFPPERRNEAETHAAHIARSTTGGHAIFRKARSS